MTKVICNHDDCINNSDGICGLETINIHKDFLSMQTVEFCQEFVEKKHSDKPCILQIMEKLRKLEE